MRLIDADALMCDIGETVLFSGKPDIVSAELRGARKVVDRIEAAPTVDAVEVKHGRWEIKADDYDCEYMMCSCCKNEFYPFDADTVDTTPNYCPNCGAKMDTDENE